MKRLVFVACALVGVLALPVAAAAQPVHADSPRVTVTVTNDVAVGTTVLRPGAYKFQCRTFDGKTYLVVTSVEKGKEITRVECVREMLDNKVSESELVSLLRADGQRRLIGVRIKGEMVSHRVVD